MLHCYYHSKRGMLLLWVQEPLDVPVLTMENYVKWYYLHLIRPDGTVEELSFEPLSDTSAHMSESPYCDHVPNPVVVQRLAHERNWHLDPNALEMIIGRWELEVRDNYPEPA
jgi:hypothetical protein